MGDDDLVEDGFECGQDGVDVLVRHHADNSHELAEVELRGQCGGESTRTVGIVGGVEKDRRRTPNTFEATGIDDRGEPVADCVLIQLSIRTGAEERFDGSERERGVARLMLTVKGEEDVGVHTTQALKFELLSTYRDLASKHLELRAFTRDRGLDLDCSAQQYLHDFGSLLGDDRDGVHRNQVLAALLDDPGLLLRDSGQVGAQVLGVIEADRRDHRDLSVDYVRGVPASAEADLDHGDVHRSLRECRIGHRSEHFELAHRRSPASCDCASIICTYGSISRNVST